jgi:NTP pyrophosphatase (non-canonical NTP hydrolase)
MGYGTDGLTFNTLRSANIKRLPLFKDAKGRPAHSEPDGSDWSLGEWCNAVLGELGEAANIIKKVKRGDLTLDEARESLAKEYADVVIYLDLLAFRTGVNLGEAVMAKWNEVSKRVGAPLYIDAEDWHYTKAPDPLVCSNEGCGLTTGFGDFDRPACKNGKTHAWKDNR